MTSLFCKIREPTRKPAEFIGDNSESGARKVSSDRRSNLEVVRREDAEPDEADGRKKSNGSSLTILETDNEVKRRGLKEKQFQDETNTRSKKERTVDALASGGEEGRGKLRKAPGNCKQVLIRRYPNGATRQSEGLTPAYSRGERRELKHLSTCRKRKKYRCPE